MEESKKDFIEVSLDRVRQIIDTLPNEFSTAKVIHEYSGAFFSNAGTPAAYSFNALFGKLLKRNSEFLGIKEVRVNEPTQDDKGCPTSTSIWVRLDS